MIEIAHAAVDATKFGAVVDPIFNAVIKPGLTLLFCVGFLVFVFGIAEMIIKGDDADVRKRGKIHMLSGAFGMFLMMSAWGIIYLIANTVRSIWSQ